VPDRYVSAEAALREFGRYFDHFSVYGGGASLVEMIRQASLSGG